MRSKIKLAVFDLDGTLLNTLDDIAASSNFALQTLGYPLRTTDEIRSFVGKGAYNLMSKCLPDNVEKSEENIDKLRDIYRNHYEENQFNTTVSFSGVEKLLGDLTESGVKLAVLSNKTHSSTIQIAEHYFPNKMEIILGFRKEVPSKPDPAALIEIMDSLKVAPEETVFIGDSIMDMAAGVNAKVAKVIGVSWGFQSRERLLEAGGNPVVDTAEELFKVITE